MFLTTMLLPNCLSCSINPTRASCSSNTRVYFSSMGDGERERGGKELRERERERGMGRQRDEEEEEEEEEEEKKEGITRRKESTRKG